MVLQFQYCCKKWHKSGIESHNWGLPTCIRTWLVESVLLPIPQSLVCNGSWGREGVRYPIIEKILNYLLLLILWVTHMVWARHMGFSPHNNWNPIPDISILLTDGDLSRTVIAVPVAPAKEMLGGWGGAWTTSVCIIVSCPFEFSALQLYSPWSLRVTSFINKLPSGRTRSRLLWVRTCPFTW